MQKRDLIIEIKSGRAGGGGEEEEELEERFRARNDGKILSHHRYEDTIY